MAARRKRGKKKDPRLVRARVKGYNKPRRTPKHPKKKIAHCCGKSRK